MPIDRPPCGRKGLPLAAPSASAHGVRRGRSAHKRFAAACALTFAALLLLPAGSRGESTQVATTQDQYDFGSVRQGANVRHEFAIRNSGSTALRFSAAELSMPGMKARLGSAEIAPGAEGTVTLEWTTDHVAGAVQGVAHIRWSDPAQPEALLTMHGTVVPALSIEPIPAVYLSAYANEPAERILTIRNNDSRPLTLSHAQAGAHATATLSTVEAGKVFTVAVRPAAHAVPGKYEESLSIQTDNAAIGTITIPVHVWVKPDLYANPDVVDFGSIPREAAQRAGAADAMLTQVAVLRRRSGAFEIKSIVSDSPLVVVTQTPSGPSESFTLQMKLRPEALFAGTRIDGKIRVKTSDRRFPEIDLPMSGEVTPSAE